MELRINGKGSLTNTARKVDRGTNVGPRGEKEMTDHRLTFASDENREVNQWPLTRRQSEKKG